MQDEEREARREKPTAQLRNTVQPITARWLWQPLAPSLEGEEKLPLKCAVQKSSSTPAIAATRPETLLESGVEGAENGCAMTASNECKQG